MKAQAYSEKYLRYIDILNEIGIALSAEKDRDRLLGKVVSSAMELSHADGGTLYLVSDDGMLKFEVLLNRPLGLSSQLDQKVSEFFPPIPLYKSDGSPNLASVVSYCYHQNTVVNIPDAYQHELVTFDFSEVEASDARLGYCSKSFLAVPLCNHEGQTIGVMELINARDDKTDEIIPFSEDKTHLVASLSSQAAIALTQGELIAAQKKLFESLLTLIAKAIDEKSKYTSNHCSRVPVLSLQLAEALNRAKQGVFTHFHLSEDEMEELRIAAWLHDCGKISIPEYVVDKATKLETLFDRIELIRLRFEILKRDWKIAHLEKNKPDKEKKRLDEAYQEYVNRLQEDENFLRRVNQGGEYLSESDQQRIVQLSQQSIEVGGTSQPFLLKEEVENLSISRGTLNSTERLTIQNHVSVTKKMLTSLPYPRYLKRVPEIASHHHERVDGGGYPDGVRKEDMSVQARIVAIADVFEALTAADRPYKSAKKLSEVMSIMTRMAETGHIDPDLFEILIKEKIHLDYAKKYLDAGQNDLE